MAEKSTAACIFCSIAQAEMQASIVRETDTVLAMMEAGERSFQTARISCVNIQVDF
jgi:hypothetical protein